MNKKYKIESDEMRGPASALIANDDNIQKIRNIQSKWR